MGELNIGELVRGHHGDAAFNVGFTTYTGTVTAASDCGAPAELQALRVPAWRQERNRIEIDRASAELAQH